MIDYRSLVSECSSLVSSNGIITILIDLSGEKTRRDFVVGERNALMSLLVDIKTDEDKVFIYNNGVLPSSTNWVCYFPKGMRKSVAYERKSAVYARKSYQVFGYEFLGAGNMDRFAELTPFGLLDALSNHERTQAESALIEAVQNCCALRPVLGLAYLRSAPAVSILSRVYERSVRAHRICIATAIWNITSDEAWARKAAVESIDALAELDHVFQPYDIINIFYFLGLLPQFLTDSVLNKSIRNDFYLIKHNARRALNRESGFGIKDAADITDCPFPIKEYA